MWHMRACACVCACIQVYMTYIVTNCNVCARMSMGVGLFVDEKSINHIICSHHLLLQNWKLTSLVRMGHPNPPLAPFFLPLSTSTPAHDLPCKGKLMTTLLPIVLLVVRVGFAVLTGYKLPILSLKYLGLGSKVWVCQITGITWYFTPSVISVLSFVNY